MLQPSGELLASREEATDGSWAPTLRQMMILKSLDGSKDSKANMAFIT